jgi:hypothetical protein
VWSAANGYPRTLTLHEQRLVAAGSAKFPQTIWGSRTGEYLDFTKGTDDDDGYSFTIAADEINPISYLASLRNLVVHTYGGEFSLQGGVEKPTTWPATNDGSFEFASRLKRMSGADEAPVSTLVVMFSSSCALT